MELVCVRHGRTAWNGLGRFQGHTDIPLDDEGRAQATALAAHLRDESFDIAVSSDLARARETAEIVLAALAAPPPLECDPALREMRFGTWEGLTWDEIVAAHPELARDHHTRPKFYTPDAGESFDDVCVRVRAALARVISRLAPDGRALVVCHAGVLHAVLRVLLPERESSALEVRFVPASITRFRTRGEQFELASINETAQANAAPLP